MKVVNIETKQSAYMMAHRVMSEAELQQSATKCNKLRCLALHAMSEWLSALLWLADTHLGKCLEPHIDVYLCTALRRKYNDAYRKAKKELRWTQIPRTQKGSNNTNRNVLNAKKLFGKIRATFFCFIKT